jgi:signal transduction histidine kinase
MKQLLATIIETNRTMQLALWNDKLEFLGARAALAELVGEFGRAHDVTARISLPEEDPDLSRAQGVALLRCAEEGLRNIARHAQASEVDVILDDDGEQIMLTVRDNGVGLGANLPVAAVLGATAPGADASGAAAPDSSTTHGLRLLRERARALGGTLTLAPGPAGGAALAMTLPKAPRPPAAA